MSEPIMNIQQILDCLPQRYPFIMVDRVIEVELPDRLIAVKNVSANEPYFLGHFPGVPVMPGVMILEALAQAAILLAYQRQSIDPNSKGLNYFAGINDARFTRVVVPGDQLRLDVRFLREKMGLWKIYGEASVDGELACSAEMICVRKDLTE
jgi:3-hydroxyacyl-[acyl-carrier-protein] dehydratase